MQLVNQSVTGFMDIVKRRLKFGKKETDIREEAKIQNAQNQENASGINIREEINQSGQDGQRSQNVNPEHIEIDIQANNRIPSPRKPSPRGQDVPYNHPSKNYNVEKYVDQENLD
jgi:hypothetical protein